MGVINNILFIGEVNLGGTSGGLLFTDTNNLLAQDATRLFWDQTAKALNINTTSSLGALMVNADSTNPNNTVSYLNQSSNGTAGVTIYGEQVQIQSGFTTISTSVTSAVIGLAYNNQPGVITMTGGGTLNQFGAQAITASNNVRLGSAGTGTGNLDVRGYDASVTSGPTFNSNGTSTVIGTGVNSVITLSPTLTAVGASSTYTTYGGKFVNSSTSGGNANLTSDAYGVYGVASGNLTTTGTTRHLAGYFQATGTADNNYSLYIDTPSGATTANIALYIAGGTIQFAGLGTGLGHFGSTGILTSSLIVNADITAGTIDLTTKVTGVLPIANGGTNSSSLTNTQVMFFNNTSIVGDSNFVWDNTNKYLGIGVTPGAPVDIVKSYSSNGFFFGLQAHPKQTAANTQGLYGMNLTPEATNTSGTVANIFGMQLAPLVSGSGGTTTNMYALYLNPQQSAGTVTQMITLYMHSTGTFATKYGLYQDTADTNYLQGSLGIGLIPTKRLELDTDSAQKPTTNTWTITSDARVKENISPFTDGLDLLMKIRPINYTYNGLAGLPRDTGIGIIAQDIQKIAPYTISTYKRKLNPDDVEETELLGFESHAFTFILINAVQELANRVELLEKGGA